MTSEQIREEVEAQAARERAEFAKPETEGPAFSESDLSRALQEGQDGDAWLYIESHRSRLCFDHSEGQWYAWQGHYWKPDIVREHLAAVDAIIARYVDEARRWGWLKHKAAKAGDTEGERVAKVKEDAFLRRIKDLHTLKQKRAVIELAAAGASSLGITGIEWDADPWLLGCENGVIDLRTGTHRPGTAAEYIRTVAAVHWTGLETPAPTFQRFMAEVFDGKETLIKYIQRLFGYAITGHSKDHVFPILWGEGRNGKGTILELFAWILGELAGPIKAEMLLDQGRTRASSSPDSDIMALRGKRMVWASETEEDARLSIGRVKWLCGGDSLTGRTPYGRREISFRPTHKLFLLTNHRPKTEADDFAFWQRAALIPFQFSFVDSPTEPNHRQRDPDLLDKLKPEGPGILAWLVRGCLAWQEEGLNPPESVHIATQDYRDHENDIGSFIADCCLIDQRCRTQAGALRDRYRSWCEETGRKAKVRKLSDHLTARFQKEEQRNIVYIGIGLLGD